MSFGVVAIGRNEGERLKQCLKIRLRGRDRSVYVDSGSTDGSVQWASRLGVDVVELDLNLPFTAARARNAGFRRLRELAPDLNYVQFIDGDCELNRDWPAIAATILSAFKRQDLRGARPQAGTATQSDRSTIGCAINEWDVPIGEVSACGGDVMMRVDAFEAAGGYRDELIAGEEPELCVRLRAAGWKVWRLDHEMTLHDAAMLHFSQWWRRQVREWLCVRARGASPRPRTGEALGLGVASGAALGSRLSPCYFIGALVIFGWLGALLLLIYPLQILRRMSQHARVLFVLGCNSPFLSSCRDFRRRLGSSGSARDHLTQAGAAV